MTLRELLHKPVLVPALKGWVPFVLPESRWWPAVPCIQMDGWDTCC
jgi:hypothetical protein